MYGGFCDGICGAYCLIAVLRPLYNGEVSASKESRLQQFLQGELIMYNKAIVRRISLDAFNQGNTAVLDEVVAGAILQTHRL